VVRDKELKMEDGEVSYTLGRSGKGGTELEGIEQEERGL
jgi:hypothetical protein